MQRLRCVVMQHSLKKGSRFGEEAVPGNERGADLLLLNECCGANGVIPFDC